MNLCVGLYIIQLRKNLGLQIKESMGEGIFINIPIPLQYI